MISHRIASLLMVSTFALAACGKSPTVADAEAGADLIITGGPILTMEGAGTHNRRSGRRRRRQDRLRRFEG